MIGIVGGVGPYAGLDLFRKVLDNTRAGSDQEHLDVVMLSVPGSITDRTGYLVGEVAENPGRAMAGVVQKLEAAGAVVAGIPCSTAHVPEIFNLVEGELQAAGSHIRLLHMIDETVAFMRALYPGLSRIGVLSTTGSYLSNVYHHALESAGYQVVKPDAGMQSALIHPAIYHPVYGIKSVSNPVHPRSRENLKKGFSTLKKQGAEAVILGCTEIPIAFPDREVMGMAAIDPTLALARALVRHVCPEKLKPASEIA
jgi:aspartate racemase